MKLRDVFLTTAALLAVMAFAGCAIPKGSTVDDKKAFIDEMRLDTMKKFRQEAPYVTQNARNAAGYGVFSNISTSLLLVSLAGGYGVVRDNRTGKDTYMRMGQLGIGPGLGVNDLRVVLVFQNAKTLDRFVEKGWEFGGDAAIAAKSGETGGAVNTKAYMYQDILIYAMTETGVAFQITLGGTRFWKDDELN